MEFVVLLNDSSYNWSGILIGGTCVCLWPSFTDLILMFFSKLTFFCIFPSPGWRM